MSNPRRPSSASARTGTKRRAPPLTALTHVGKDGRARMVNVAGKPETARMALASAAVRMSAATLALIEAREGPKGDVIATARLAAVSALKRTAELIPLCHPVRVVGCEVDFALDRALPGVRIFVQVNAFDRTGVEMEALVGGSVAALTIYDMVKAVDRTAQIEQVRLEEKSGGRSGRWKRGESDGGLEKRRRAR